MTEYPLRIGLVPWLQATSWSEIRETARVVDGLGFDHLWAVDHIYPTLGRIDQPMFEGWTTLAAYAAITSHPRLGVFCTANTFRNPTLLAKMAVTLDHISGGRAILGLGGGWHESEHVANGIPFGRSAGERLDWLGESSSLIRRILAGDEVTHEGPRYHASNLRQFPRPVQERLPMLIGGTGEKKTLPTVARVADIWNADGPLEVLKHKNRVLERCCAEIGRDSDEIERSVGIKVVIRDTPAEAQRVWDQQMVHNQRTPQDADRDPWLGPPDMIVERLAAHMEAGFSTFMVELIPPHDHETILRLARDVRPQLSNDK